jgi:hypothetical protein
MKRVVKREAPAALEVLQAMGLAKRGNAQYQPSSVKIRARTTRGVATQCKNRSSGTAGRHKKSVSLTKRLRTPNHMPSDGIEPATSSLLVTRSTIELRGLFGMFVEAIFVI